MTLAIIVGLATLAAVMLVGVLVVVVLPRRVAAAARGAGTERLDSLERALGGMDRAFRDELVRNRAEAAQAGGQLRDEVRSTLKDTSDSLQQRLDRFATQLVDMSSVIAERLEDFQRATDERLRSSSGEQTAKLDQTREALTVASSSLRAELAQSMKGFGDSLDKRLAESSSGQLNQLGLFGARLEDFQRSMDERLRIASADQTSKLDQTRTVLGDATSALRAELATSIKAFGDSLDKRLVDSAATQFAQLGTFGTRLENLTSSNEKKLQEMRIELGTTAAAQRLEISSSLKNLSSTLSEQVTGIASLLKKETDAFSGRLLQLSEMSEKRLNDLRGTVDAKLQQIQEDNAARLETMRQTVDEKLQGTLDKRLGDSFKQVSERLEAVQKGLGEMNSLACNVGDLKKVLTNVKTRGTWGEVQLGSLLEQVLAPNQYQTNAQPKPGSGERVEFAIRLPGRDDDGSEVLLPIDAKFPVEDYLRLVEASEKGDVVAVEDSTKQLVQRVKSCAKDIHDKYVNPPRTTDFALLYLPTEGLYAEVAKRPGLLELLQRDYKVTVAGPTTLLALLNALQMGFNSLVIQKRSSEVWQLLGAVKTEFAKFGLVFDKVGKKLQEAKNQLDEVGKRRNAMERKLRDVQELPPAEMQSLLPSSFVVEPEDGVTV